MPPLHLVLFIGVCVAVMGIAFAMLSDISKELDRRRREEEIAAAARRQLMRRRLG